ncbi:MAG: S4 domain-containing protein [Elusimicrobiota bacterium]
MSVWVEVPFQAQGEESGRRVDAFLALRLKRYSRSQVQGLIAQGRVLLRGRAVKAATRVCAGETVVVRYPKTPEPPCAQRPSRIPRTGRIRGDPQAHYGHRRSGFLCVVLVDRHAPR